MYLKLFIFVGCVSYAVGNDCWYTRHMDDVKHGVECPKGAICSSTQEQTQGALMRYDCKTRGKCREEIGTEDGCNDVTVEYYGGVTKVYTYCCCLTDLCTFQDGPSNQPNTFLLTLLIISLMVYVANT